MKDWIVFEKYNNVSLFWQLVAYYDLTWGRKTDKNSILTHYKVAHMDLEKEVRFSPERDYNLYKIFGKLVISRVQIITLSGDWRGWTVRARLRSPL